MSQVTGLLGKAKTAMSSIKGFSEKFIGSKEPFPAPSETESMSIGGNRRSSVDTLHLAISHHSHDDLGTWTYVSVDLRGATLRTIHFNEDGSERHYHGRRHLPNIPRVDEPAVNVTMEDISKLEDEVRHAEEKMLDVEWEVVGL